MAADIIRSIEPINGNVHRYRTIKRNNQEEWPHILYDQKKQLMGMATNIIWWKKQSMGMVTDIIWSKEGINENGHRYHMIKRNNQGEWPQILYDQKKQSMGMVTDIICSKEGINGNDHRYHMIKRSNQWEWPEISNDEKEQSMEWPQISYDQKKQSIGMATDMTKRSVAVVLVVRWYFNCLLVLFCVLCFVCRKCLPSPRCRSELIDTSWVVIVPG